MRSLTISITWEDIAKGRPGPYTCPSLIAAKRAFKGTGKHPISSNWKHLWIEGEMYYNLPKEAGSWIILFDRGVDVGPITFNIDMDALVTEPWQ